MLAPAEAALTALPGVRANRPFQASWVVPSADQAAALWTRTMGVGPFFVFADVEVDEFLYRGTPSRYGCRVAIAQAGDMQIELIEQPHDLPSAYRDLVPKGRSGFHHVGLFAEDFDREVAAYDALGFVRAAEGRVGAMRFAYIDTSPAIGCMVEILAEDAAMRGAFAGIAAAAQGWNGERPLRGIEELVG
jgi:hypothetical protein